MGKIVSVLLVLGCGWLIWTLTKSVETSASAHYASSDAVSREFKGSEFEKERTSSTTDAEAKARSWARSITDAIPATTPAGKRNILAGAGILLGLGILWMGFRKR